MSPTRLPGTPRLLRALNDRAALELLLERGPLTRAQLGELTGLSKVTASQLVERLEERGLVARVGEQAGGRGPNAQLYAVVPGQRATWSASRSARTGWSPPCADITGSDRRAGRAVAPGTPTTRSASCTPPSSRRPAAAGRRPDRVRRVVLGTPGLVDPKTGDITFAWDLPRWHRGLLAALRERPGHGRSSSRTT